ncbi:hypothetical protein ES706_00733 [subsurface metagenome]|nr:hypothetical protein [Hadesarchaea archaeon]
MKNSKPKIVLLVAVASILVIGSILFITPRHRAPLEGKVESIYVHYADGYELNLDPASGEGKELIAACNGVLNHMHAAIEGLISKEEFEEKLTKTYAYLGLHVQGVEIGLYFIFGNFEHGWGWVGGEYVPEGYGWGWALEGPDFAFTLELRNLIEELRPEHGGRTRHFG